MKSFKYKTNLLGPTITQPAPNQTNGILRNVTIAVLSKYLCNFWQSPEMSFINCKVESKLKWKKHCVLPVADVGNNDSDGGNSNNIIFTKKDTKLYVPVVTLSVKDNQTLSKFLSKRFERSGCWNEYKRKNENKNTAKKYRHFLESNFVGVNRLFF